MLVMKKEAENWIMQAKNDLKASTHSFQSEDYGWACFQVQQAVEKGLKAILISKENNLIKTHDLIFLGQKVQLPEAFVAVCKELSGIYLYIRYPDAAEVKDIKGKALRYISIAEEILQWVQTQL